MKILCALLTLLCSLPLPAQSGEAFDLPGVLRLVDKPPEATPVDALSFRIHPLAGGFDIQAQPDKDGKFILRHVHPGRYSLTFPMPGRLEVFAIGQQALAPDNFELTSQNSSALSIIVSMKTARVIVKVQGVESGLHDAVALLVPAEDHLTLRESCYSLQLTAPEAVFPFVPPGKYRVLVFNTKYSSDVAAYAPRSAEFLADHSVTIEASSDKNVSATASYVPNEIIENAIRLAGGPYPPPQDHPSSPAKE
jgi:hypothetical protein